MDAQRAFRRTGLTWKQWFTFLMLHSAKLRSIRSISSKITACKTKGELLKHSTLDIQHKNSKNGWLHSLFNKNVYLLTPWCRVLLEKLTGLQLVKKFPAFYGTRRFITALTSLRHTSLTWVNPIQSIYAHPTPWRSILILSTHLRLCLPSGLFPSGFPTKTLYTPRIHVARMRSEECCE